mmetsp:Transcript_11358/g.31887  ORF Transcript_11358/g.31887 Transcript_11358/m.31887 type:complete len:110 (+) Transcript_11358:436-765(+)
MSFHGAPLAPVGAPMPPQGGAGPYVVVYNGAEDASVPPGDLAGFAAEMSNASARWELHDFYGARHAFTEPAFINASLANPQSPVEYSEHADRRSWESTLGLLALNFGRA